MLLPRFDRALLATYVRPEWPRAILLATLLLAGIGLQLVNPQIARVFIDRAQAGEPLEGLVSIAVLFLAVAMITQATSVAETYVAEDLGWRTTNTLRADLTRHVLALDGRFHAQHTAGELIERIDGDVAAIADFFARFVVRLVGNCVFLVGVLVLLLVEDWRIGVVLTACVLVAFVFMIRGGGTVAKQSRAARQSAADLSSYVEERLAGLPDIKSSGADAYAMRRLHERLAARFATAEASASAASLFNAVLGLFFVLGTGLALGLGLVLHANGWMTSGTIFVVFRYTGMLRQPLERLVYQMNRFQTATGSIIRVRELLGTQARIVDGPGAQLPKGALAVEFHEVVFAYADGKPVLDGLTFCLRPGEVLGVVGRTGAGKTTLSRLLLRLEDPQCGVIRLNGVDVRHTTLEELRSRIGLVTQEVQLVHASLRDNIALFDDAVRDSQLLQVFSELGLTGWLAALPDGLDTLLGPGGRGLSAGEAQLVAMARVFLKDPGVVMLDEASSRLDPATERLLERAIARLLRGRTGIVIAHRLAALARADRRLTLKGGVLV